MSDKFDDEEIPPIDGPDAIESEDTADDEGIPLIERPDALEPEDAADVAPRDSEIDFDDESEEDIGPIDYVEAAEADALLDDPEALDDEQA